MHCGNMWNASENAYGHTLCLSPQNGQHTRRGSTSPTTADSKTGNGYSYTGRIPPPENSRVAQGTTMSCARWHVAQKDDACVDMTLVGPTTIDIFLRVNPSLGKDIATCSTNIVANNAYCVLPTYNWDIVDSMTTTVPSTTAPTPTPTQAGIALSCNRFHFVVPGQSCSAVACENRITLADFPA
jgi:hypothetical protein